MVVKALHLLNASDSIVLVAAHGRFKVGRNIFEDFLNPSSRLTRGSCSTLYNNHDGIIISKTSEQAKNLTQFFLNLPEQ